MEYPLYLTFARHLLLVQCLELVLVIKTRFECLILAVFWVVTPYVIFIRHKYFEGTCCLHFQD